MSARSFIKLCAALSPEAADFVFTGGKIYTVNDLLLGAQAVPVKGDKIVCVADAAGAGEFVGDRTQKIDVAGKPVRPGFISAHDHLIASAWTTFGAHSSNSIPWTA